MGRTRVYITVDTECSMGGAWVHADRRPLGADRCVFCRDGNKSYGIPFIDAELRRFGLRATFFCEVFAARANGEGDVRAATDFLSRQGHDVQLHIHPTFRHYGEWLASPERSDAGRAARSALSDNIGSYNEVEQEQLLAEACEIFARCTGRKPQVFRAGSYAANLATLRALARLGVVIDSSYNPAYAWSFPEADLEPNHVRKLEGVWELPVTVTRTGFPDTGPWKHLEISAVSFDEMCTALESAHESGMGHVVLVFHSFSLIKPRDIFYSQYRFNHIVARRFRRLLGYLAINSQKFDVSTVGRLAAEPALMKDTGAVAVPDLGWWRPPVRKLVQAVNRIYWV